MATHIVSHAQDGRNVLAIVDETTGELHQFAQVAWPEGFGISESAVLATNLSSFLGVERAVKANGNGKRKSALPAAEGITLFSHISEPEVVAELPPPLKKAAKAPKPELNKKGQPRQRAATRHRDESKSHIKWADIVTIVKAHPNGCTYLQIAQILSKKEDPDKSWKTLVANRFQANQGRLDQDGIKIEYRDGQTANGTKWPEQKFLVPI